MNASALAALHTTSSFASGELRIRSSLGSKSRVNALAKPSSDSVNVRDLRWPATTAQPVGEQFFHLEPDSGWAATNLKQVLGTAAEATADELALAKDALSRMDDRRGELPRAWAESLGRILGSYND